MYERDIRRYSDTAVTGKMYKKLDAYGDGRYLGSTKQFATQKKFKAYMHIKFPEVKKITTNISERQ